ncbi:hypothetical protein UREG_05963 [Uncinocarpus reesii 1704]|uniref:Alcohol dehydrogenase-like N-terminal domain-containing protein n=1 Tax=Uncinocarpus reesii (strain UAMH 1704) TaxID=336963 RepID=C4JU24_UNCRE|nr:uncharacterized protein UREG_05963 [Uncinocarpus reesii 1704]EEP81121.1 hypothetical protein UREG_05963 [Uncinocarpus reesii 1704]
MTSTAQDVSNPARDPDQYSDPSGETMKAVVWMGKNDVKVGVVSETEKGDILGHEFCGKVEAVGSAIKNLNIGDRVVASFQIACGQCMYCKKGHSSQCERTNESSTMASMFGGRTAGIFGYSHLTGGFAGGQAEYVRVPFGEVNLLPLPDDVSDEKGLYLSDVLCTSWHCVADTGVNKGDVVAIWGAGPIGQMCARFSLMHGASRVIIIDGGNGAWRLQFTKSKIPQVECVNFSDLPKGESVTSMLNKMVHGGPDVALECAAGEYAKSWAHYFQQLLGMETDTSELLNEMITSVKSFGRCGVTGVYVGYVNHFNIGSLMQRGVRLIGNGQAPVHKYWKDLLAQVREGKINPLEMVTHRGKLEDMEAIYDVFNKREEGMQKIFVQTRFSDPPSADSPQLSTFS